MSIPLDMPTDGHVSDEALDAIAELLVADYLSRAEAADEAA